MGAQITPGQKFLLDLLQQKLLSNLKLFNILNSQQQKGGQQEDQLLRLKEKIRRISAKQKRFTIEILDGNANNTIPKESFLRALGLVTKEDLVKINSRSGERRRRTTANPRFSHEAIQAKRALEPKTSRPKKNKRDVERQISLKVRQVTEKQTSNRLLHEFGKLLGQRNSVIARAIDTLLQNKATQPILSQQRQQQQQQQQQKQKQKPHQNPQHQDEAHDIWLRCDESLDDLD